MFIPSFSAPCKTINFLSRIVKRNRERKQKEKIEKKIADKTSTSNTGKIVASTVDRKTLHNFRVVQRNLLYVIGLPISSASEETLRKPEYFGQYGKIAKIVAHKNTSGTHPTGSAYVTFAYKEDAKAAIQALDGFWIEGHPLRASFGTTKYCNNFIKNVPCTNPECVYLHELGDDDDRFTKEEIQASAYTFIWSSLIFS
jgi:CCR4-NOT transcription complex subunit 4